MVDLTNPDGRYDIAIELPPGVDENANRIEIEPDGRSRRVRQALRPAEIRASLEKMGLRIEALREKLDTIVVDHAETEPTAN
jgi:uncharacterized protein (TIGR03435 family)